MGAFARSWEITKLSLEVIKKDKEMLLFPILSAIFSLIFIVTLLMPSVLWPLLSQVEMDAQVQEAYVYMILFLIYLGTAMIATFFNVCTVYTVKKRFEGGNARFGESIGFAFSRIHQIFAWGLLSATVGILLRLIERLGRKQGAAGELITKLITSIIGGVWSIVTLFVIPSMVYKGIGPFQAIKDSIQTLKKTWGESLIREIGTGLAQLALFVMGILLFGAMIFLTLSTPMLAFSIFLLALLYFVLLATIFSLINAVFNTALYVYSETGKVPAFDEELIKGAFRHG